MAHYIDKDALVAEIERRKKYYENIQMIKPVYESNIEDFNELLSLIDTLEVEEVDDEPECKIFPRPIGCYSTCKECPLLATNNKSQKGEEA